MVWKMLKSHETKLVTLKAKLEAREERLLASGLPKERNCYDPMVRHLLAESRKIRRSIAAHARAHESAAERGERLAKLNEGKPSKPGREPKAAKEPRAAKAPEVSATPAEAATETGTPHAS